MNLLFLSSNILLPVVTSRYTNLMLEKAITFKKFEQSFQTRILEIVEY